MTDLSNTITIKEAAALKGVSIQAIDKAIERGDIRVEAVVGNRRLLNRADVERYQPINYPKPERSE